MGPGPKKQNVPSMFTSNKKATPPPDVAAASADVTMFEEEFKKPVPGDDEEIPATVLAA